MQENNPTLRNVTLFLYPCFFMNLIERTAVGSFPFGGCVWVGVGGREGDRNQSISDATARAY